MPLPSHCRIVSRMSVMSALSGFGMAGNRDDISGHEYVLHSIDRSGDEPVDDNDFSKRSSTLRTHVHEGEGHYHTGSGPIHVTSEYKVETVRRRDRSMGDGISERRILNDSS